MSYFKFYAKSIIAILLILILSSCRTVKTSESKEKQTKVEQTTTKQTEIKEELLEKISRLLEQSKSSMYESNLSLIPSKESEVVRYIEMREGKPYRDIEIQGGSLQERKQTRDTLYIRDTTTYKAEYSSFQRKIDSLKGRITELEKQSKTIEKKGNSFAWSFWLWVVIGIVALKFIRCRFKLF